MKKGGPYPISRFRGESFLRILMSRCSQWNMKARAWPKRRAGTPSPLHRLWWDKPPCPSSIVIGVIPTRGGREGDEGFKVKACVHCNHRRRKTTEPGVGRDDGD
jgi:hypothetical protein